MTSSYHNPDQYMFSLRSLISQGRKRIGFLIGAGAPAGIFLNGSPEPLIPAVAGLTKQVLTALDPKFSSVVSGIQAEVSNANIEVILSRVRSLSAVIGTHMLNGLDAQGYLQLGNAICAEIGAIVDKRLPDGASPYTELVSWISGTSRQHPVEVFTTNYDLLLEEAMERSGIPFYDGFSGSHEPFFDPSTVAANDLPARWARIWKLHGSLGWSANSRGEVIRKGGSSSTHLVFPEHLKYDLTQKAPYSALFDRLKSFLRTPDTLLITTGFSFADAHIAAVIQESLTANPAGNVIAFQFRNLDEEQYAVSTAGYKGNMSVYCPDQALINGIIAPWRPGDPPTRDWESIRSTYWKNDGGEGHFTLGAFSHLTRFFAGARASQAISAPESNIIPFPIELSEQLQTLTIAAEVEN